MNEAATKCVSNSTSQVCIDGLYRRTHLYSYTYRPGKGMFTRTYWQECTSLKKHVSTRTLRRSLRCTAWPAFPALALSLRPSLPPSLPPPPSLPASMNQSLSLRPIIRERITEMRLQFLAYAISFPTGEGGGGEVHRFWRSHTLLFAMLILSYFTPGILFCSRVMLYSSVPASASCDCARF